LSNQQSVSSKGAVQSTRFPQTSSDINKFQQAPLIRKADRTESLSRSKRFSQDCFIDLAFLACRLFIKNQLYVIYRQSAAHQEPCDQYIAVILTTGPLRNRTPG